MKKYIVCVSAVVIHRLWRQSKPFGSMEKNRLFY